MTCPICGADARIDREDREYVICWAHGTVFASVVPDLQGPAVDAASEGQRNRSNRRYLNESQRNLHKKRRADEVAGEVVRADIAGAMAEARRAS